MLKNFDYKCSTCGREQVDVIKPAEEKTFPCFCGGLMERAWLMGGLNNVLGDEIDVEIKHGLCNSDGTPRRFRSRQELKRAADRVGWTPYVVHEGSRGSDKSKHTTRWI